MGPSGTLVPLHAEQRFIRLGGGVDASRCTGAPALGRLREALLAYRAVAEAWAVSAVVVGATSASRDAVNREAVIDFVHRETGLVYEVLSGKEERFFSRPPRSEEVAAAEALVARLYREADVRRWHQRPGTITPTSRPTGAHGAHGFFISLYPIPWRSRANRYSRRSPL